MPKSSARRMTPRSRNFATARVRAHVRRAAESGNASKRRGRAVAGKIDLQGRADEHVAGVVSGGLAERAIAAHRAVWAGEEYVRSRADVVFHAELGPERM